MNGIKIFTKKYRYEIVIGFIVLLGIFIRAKSLVINPSFWHDECGLAWNIKFKSSMGLFGHLRFLQVAPPFFLLVTKFFTKLFGFSEIVFRFFPFITGCLSLVAFYFLCEKTLTKKFSTLCALFLFSINQNLINYSFEFKPYGSDAFFTIICLLFFINFKIEKLTAKKALLYGVLLSIIPWFSFISVFFLAGGVLYLFFKNIKSNWKKTIALALPIFISGIIYLSVYIIANYTGTHMVSDWEEYFITANPALFFILFVKNLMYLFIPIKYVLFALGLLIWGFMLSVKEKSPFFVFSALGILMFLIASFMRIYPFAERLVVFLIPIFLLFMIKPLDTISAEKKIKSTLIILIMFITFLPAVSRSTNFLLTKTVDRGEYPREMMQFMVDNLKADDIIFVSTISDTEFAYYSSFYNIKNKFIQERLTENSKENYLKYLNTLPQGNYWFYLPFDFFDPPINPWIEAWAKSQNVQYFYKKNKSTLIYLQVK